MVTKDWRQDRKGPNDYTWWESGYGLRRNFINIHKLLNGQWRVNIYEGRGHYEDAKELPFKQFKTKTQALAYAKAYMRKN